MFAFKYLNRRPMRLVPGQEWAPDDECLWFLLVKTGEGRCQVAAPQALAPGDLAVLCGTGGVGGVNPGGDSELEFWCFSLRLEHLYPLFDCREIGLLKDVYAGFAPGKFYPAASPLARDCRRLIEEVSPEFNLDHRVQLLRVAAAVLSEEFKVVRRNRGRLLPIEDHVIEVFEGLSTEELLRLSVGELAAKFGCSRRHLNRLFHQHFGASAAALRMETRLLKAVALLKDADAKVINVAEQCGFNHLGLFNNCFKKRFGASPGRWRKRAAEARANPMDSGGGPAQANR